jgi:hypothetical protein
MMDFAATYIQAFARGMIVRKNIRTRHPRESIQQSAPSPETDEELIALKLHEGGVEMSAELLPTPPKRASLTSVFDSIAFEDTDLNLALHVDPDKVVNEDFKADDEVFVSLSLLLFKFFFNIVK